MLSLKIEAESEIIKDAKASFGKRRFKREKGRHLESIYGAPFFMVTMMMTSTKASSVDHARRQQEPISRHNNLCYRSYHCRAHGKHCVYFAASHQSFHYYYYYSYFFCGGGGGVYGNCLKATCYEDNVEPLTATDPISFDFI